MKTPLLPRRQHLRRNRGFALIVTLTLMILLTIIALGLLSLSNVTLRQSTQESALSTARSNARMALMQAIGELQTNVGADTRVTARADILDQNNPMILGAWKSWEGTDHDSTGRPIAPSYGDKQKSADSGGRFLRWLVSGNPDQLKEVGNLPDGKTGKDKITLVGENTLALNAADNQQIHLDPVLINNSSGKPTGGYAWWVGGENQKALLPRPEKEGTSKSNASWASLMQSSSIANTKPFNLDALRQDPTISDKITSLKQVDFISGQPTDNRASRANFYDLSSYSVGLLTNTATGGWRKDMSLFTEKYNDVATSNLPLFRITPEKDSSQSKANNSQPTAANSMLYPWAAYRSGSLAYEKTGPVCNWANLANYATMYKQLGNGPNFSIAATAPKEIGNLDTYFNKIKPMPILARLQWVYSYAVTIQSATSKRLTVKMTPVVTLWNPYNVTLSNIGKLVFTIGSKSTMPVALDYTVVYQSGATVSGGGYRSLTGNGSYSGIQGDGNQPQFYVEQVGSILPGECKVFSVPGGNSNTLATRTLKAGEGFNADAGHFLQISEAGSRTQIYSPKDGSPFVKVRTKVKFDNMNAKGTAAGKYGMRLVVRDDQDVVNDPTFFGRHDGAADGNEMVYELLAPSSTALPDEIPLPEIDLANIGTNGFPLFSLVYGLRASDNIYEPGETHNKNKLAKGFVQTSPFATASNISLNAGSGYRVNAAYDVNLIVHTSNPDSLPNSSVPAVGYVWTGLTQGLGMSRFIAADLPVKPLASLPELQGWDIRFGNPAPPYSYNVIGNSDASPIIASNAIDNGDTSNTNLQYDDSYCANHVLFDDWFFSSINMGDVDKFGQGNDLKSNYSNFVSGKKSLTNTAYQPISADLASSQESESANELYSKYVEPQDSWRTVASRLEVKGMFNVNSTSIVAWKALLEHARGQQVPYYQKGGSVSANATTDFAVPRYPVGGDVRADTNSQGQAGDGYAYTTQYTGHRVLTEQLIDDLAAKIVEQVRKRGPFLSLSEFVNRQLSSDKDLALGGAIQVALNEMQSSINGGIGAANANGDASSSGYKFAEAATGSSVYGVPGWVRQADVLRPLAPILSARDDTFTIRSYGDARDLNNKVIATAYCEATVRRTRNYCDPADSADSAEIPRNSTNLTFGRKFEIVSFRWLSKSEI